MSVVAGQGRPRFCGGCGTAIGERDAFCGGCGGAVQGGGASPKGTQGSPKRAAKSASRKPFLITLLVLFVLGCLGVWGTTLANDAAANINRTPPLSKEQIDRIILGPSTQGRKAP